ncbi:hypothetical protein LB543_05100 [Mesorhizobium sp. ESP7-2]|nr:hypothetical protein [Mesorhizobium sp. ESP7-2]MBZ9706096.1 hypothetical protein [Mesorhizobium sp. ESP7-2]
MIKILLITAIALVPPVALMAWALWSSHVRPEPLPDTDDFLDREDQWGAL